MRTFVLSAAVAILVASSLPFAFAGEGDALDADSMEAAKVANAYIDAFNSHDAHALSMVFTENGDFVTGRGVISHGRQAIEKYMSRGLGPGGGLNSAHRTLMVTAAQTVSAGVVSLYAMSEQTGSKTADGTVNPPTSTFFVFVIAKQGTHWGIAVFHESNLPK